MNRHHVLITGVGRAGTTFLIELLTHLGLDTGFTEETLKKKKEPRGRAGLETQHIRFDSPYIIKSPWFIDVMDTLLESDLYHIDHVFIPVRDLYSAAESRRAVSAGGGGGGAIWYTNSMKKGDQEKVLAEKTYDLLHSLSSHDVPVTLINFPLLTKDSKYLYKKLKPILKDIKFKTFDEVYNKVLQPQLVHEYKK